MKFHLLLATLSTAFLASGCGQKENTSAPPASANAPAANSSTPAASTSTPAASPSASTATPASAAAGRAIEITAADNMKFNLATIEAKPGENLKVILTNIGTLPKEAMGHNWVLLKKGTDVTAFATAAMTAKDTEYIPAAMKDQVIAATQILGPRKSEEVSFKAPVEPGEYVFLCTFPAHYLAGMKGVLVVK